MPAGEHVIHATINGEPGSARVFVDASACARLNADLAELWEASRRREHARPVLYFDHKQGEAAAFPRRFVWEDERGILLEIAEWTAAGRAAVEGANYGYISPAFRLSREDGQVLGLVPGVEVGSLVNDPAFERIDPIVDNIAASKAAPLTPGVDIVTSAHCNQHKHAPECSHGNGAEDLLVQDTTGLQAHLHDEVHPVEVNFTPEKQNLKQLRNEGKTEEYEAARKRWLNEFKEYYKTQLAGKTIEVKGSGYSMHFPESSEAKGRAAKGVRNQTRAEAGKNLIEAVTNSYHLHQGTPEHKDGEGEHRRKMVDNSDKFHVFGCPVTINGERTLMWIAATHKKGESDPKKIVFYEFGLTETKRKAGGASLVQDSKSHRADTHPAKATLLDVLRDVKSDFQGKPRFLVRKDGEKDENSNVKGSFPPPQKISTADSLACAGKCSDNGSAAKTGGNTTMTEEIKKKLGLPDDADDAAVEAAVTKLVTERDAHKKKAEDAEAACKKKDDELQAARASEKQAWLDDLKQRGVLAPKDEAAVEAAAALFEANPAAARTAYGKMQGVPAGAVITASQAVPPEEKSIEDLIQF